MVEAGGDLRSGRVQPPREEPEALGGHSQPLRAASPPASAPRMRFWPPGSRSGACAGQGWGLRAPRQQLRLCPRPPALAPAAPGAAAALGQGHCALFGGIKLVLLLSLSLFQQSLPPHSCPGAARKNTTAGTRRDGGWQQSGARDGCGTAAPPGCAAHPGCGVVPVRHPSSRGWVGKDLPSSSSPSTAMSAGTAPTRAACSEPQTA